VHSSTLLLPLLVCACQSRGSLGGPEPSDATAPVATPARTVAATPQDALAVVLRQLEAPRGTHLVFRGIDGFRVRGAGDAAEELEVRLDVEVRASDSLEATRGWSRIELDLRAQPWCLALEQRGSKVLDGDAGVRLEGVEVRVDPAVLADTGLLRAESLSDQPEVHARMAAAQSAIGQIDCRLQRRVPRQGVEETVYAFEPASRKATFPLAKVLAFLRLLEGFDEGSIESLSLDGTPGQDDAWRFQARLVVPVS